MVIARLETKWNSRSSLSMINMDSTGNQLVIKFVILSICVCHASGESSVGSVAESSSDAFRTEKFVPATTAQPVRQNRAYKQSYSVKGDDTDYQDDHHYHDDMKEDEETKAMGQPKVDYWAGYYDFLINEGSYKFWAVFQLATAALLIYSGFAALYYAKVNPPTTDDYFDGDIFRRRRRRRRRRSFPLANRDKPFAGLDAVTFQRIIEAIFDERTR
ncbi:uncharacterized protein LOC109858218 [Pseudomyrmex gracilis]|uniref:uncharacterized protein LOC109858218 n=1 Tax=Pseudomyrmex gracilis TaxID=219809 RepID=UPI000994A7A7|nr:uncharacterized protein LOC109858218 [Pseudomyrmex gracilis]